MPLIIGVLAGSNTRASLGSAEESCFAVAAGVVVTVPGAGLTCSGQGPVAGLNCAIGLSFGGFAAGSCFLSLTPAALSKPQTCYSARDEAKPSYVKCEVKFSNGRILSIKDLSDGYTFRVGENGWIPVSGKNCIRNIESGSTFCLNN